MKSIRLLQLALGLLCAAGTGAARADAYTINLDTSAIAGHADGPFYLDFQSIWGSGSAQTISVSNFTLTGGGFVAGTEWSTGAVAGDLSSGLVLSPSAGSFYNEFLQQFEATVTNIKFTVDLTMNSAGFIPTSFAVSILDGVNLYPIPTSGFADTLVMFDLDGANTSGEASVSTGSTGGVVASIPDAGSTAGLLGGALLLVVLGRRKALPRAV